MELSHKLGYRSDIDGLRAVAVLSVLGFHYGAPIRGGFTGVDVFFVISGYLITHVLAAEIATGKFSILTFYDRRMRRILPALLTMLAAVLLAGKLLLGPGDYQALANSTAAAAFGVSNIFFQNHTGYFDQVADLMPLLHTWSLAVEEQFYLVWPPLLYLLAARRKRLDVAALIAAITILGFGCSLIWFSADPTSAFYSAAPRAWELALGAFLVFIPALPRPLAGPAGWLGLAIVAAGFLSIDSAAFPGLCAAIPCAGAALVIWPKTEHTAAAKALGYLAPIGLVSYSLYLWHWPILVFYRIYINSGTPQAHEAIALAAASLAIATFSWRFIEQPPRKKRWPTAKVGWAGLAGLLLIFSASMYVDSADGLPARIPPEGLAMRSLDVMWSWPCAEIPVKGVTSHKPCVFGAPWQSAKRKTMIWGDSFASHLSPLVDAANSDPERSFALIGGCSAALGGELTNVGAAPGYTERCQRLRKEALALLDQDPLVDQVILTANWIELIGIIEGHERDSAHAIEQTLESLIRSRSNHPRFILVGITPRLPAEVVACAIRESSKLPSAPCTSSIRFADAVAVRRLSIETDAMLKNVAASAPNTVALSPTANLCRPEACDVVINGEFILRDPGHLRRNLSLQTRQQLAERIGLTDALAGTRDIQSE
ncbi:peptidoglycan/LPS O-acetylase OafA/YrhL [Bradyrhizobium japonicum]|uniref:acyltransferase family protein n=1 Tax=Bradyrhizobium japonicum TaxID=375 RepID=UPI0022262A35|nr:acyltransferase family protein [Bradyrhizobium japonicum]MCW2218626.1 peptidoglycan/LPS O-acetylase OafA/YrhL [Bradyrhizobium japonicum]MCW2343240.1 peptidoglycan/LPS O-acetylase OafA/YrhL [Bradyrhizobium japonicum]